MSTASVKWGNNTFAAMPNGYQWTKPNGQVLQGPWSDVRSLRCLQASVSLQGAIQIGNWQHIGVEFENGDNFYFHSQDPAAFGVAELLNHYATPHMMAKSRAQLQQGGTLSFGNVTLSRTSIGYKSKTWPLSSFAGHRTYQGHWMMDIGPKATPMLMAQIQLNHLPNHLVLRELLNELCPGSEYTDNSPDLGTMWRPSASSHDPRYPSGRQRLMILGGMLAVGGGAGLAVLGYSMYQSHEHEKAREAQDAQFQAALKAAMELPVESGKPWKCDVKPSPYDIAYAVRAPQNVDRPGLLDKDDPFSLSDGSASVAYGADYFIYVEVQQLTDKDADQNRVATLKAQMVAIQTKKSLCSGEAKVSFADRSQYDVSINLGKALTLLACSDDRDECKRAKSSVKFVDSSAPVVSAQPASSSSTAPAKSVKKKR